MVTAFYPGSFDPPTFGHMDVVKRAAAIFKSLIVGVYTSPSGKSMIFSSAERSELFKKCLQECMPNAVANITVEPYEGLTVEIAKQFGASVIVRGLRIGSDFEYEREMALMNRDLDDTIDTVCLLSSLRNQFVSSSRVKEIAALGGNISRLVPVCVVELMTERVGN